MNIYTSYFGNKSFLNKHNIVMIGVSRFPPKDFEGETLYDVAPSIDLLNKYKNGEITSNQYTGNYWKQLRFINVATFMDDIERISNGKDVALCCYEKPDEFCHRHILADFMNEFGLAKDVHEISNKDIYTKSVELF